MAVTNAVHTYMFKGSKLERNLEYKCAGNYLLDLFNINNKGTTATSNETFTSTFAKSCILDMDQSIQEWS